jgi:hypothetical protein
LLTLPKTQNAYKLQERLHSTLSCDISKLAAGWQSTKQQPHGPTYPMRAKTNLLFKNAHFLVCLQVHHMHQHRGDCVIKETTDFAPWQIFLQQCNTVENTFAKMLTHGWL